MGVFSADMEGMNGDVGDLLLLPRSHKSVMERGAMNLFVRPKTARFTRVFAHCALSKRMLFLGAGHCRSPWRARGECHPPRHDDSRALSCCPRASPKARENDPILHECGVQRGGYGNEVAGLQQYGADGRDQRCGKITRNPSNLRSHFFFLMGRL